MMSFFNMTFRSILGLSNSENQRISGRRNPPSPGGLTLISTTAGIASPATVLESVTLKPTPSATAAGKKITVRTDDMHDSIAGCFRPVDSAGDIRARLDRCATLTECIGFESCDLTAAQVWSVPLTAGARKREAMRREEVMVGGKNEREILPPVMSSLNENGRPRFNLEKVRKDGRLLIYKVRNDRPEIVRTVFPEEDRIKIRLIGF
ncbi:hypothetical protein C3L33_07534, partial [Rhododendron williamsianum]